MEITNIEKFKNGWFIGNFEPSLLKTVDFEIAVKKYSAGDEDLLHYHKIATEWTYILNGEVKMNNIILEKGDIVIISPNETVKFIAITDSEILVIKSPSVINDKYLI